MDIIVRNRAIVSNSGGKLPNNYADLMRLSICLGHARQILITSSFLLVSLGLQLAPCQKSAPARGTRTAMAFQIMSAVSAGERDPERLRLVALNATAGRSLHC